MRAFSKKAHWSRQYKTKDATSLGWYKPELSLSLELILTYCPDQRYSLIDCGAGASTLVDSLSNDLHCDCTAVDIAENALQISRERLGDTVKNVSWVTSDILHIELKEDTYDIWHDRATFHFLDTQTDIEHYVDQVASALKRNGYLILGVFSNEGPTSCSGLPVRRYSIEKLAAVWSPRFRLVRSVYHTHLTPSGQEQEYLYSVWENHS